MRGVRTGRNEIGDAGGGGVLAAWSVSAGRARGEYAGGDRVHVVHGGVSSFLCAEFAGPGGSGGCGADLLGLVCLSGGSSGRDGSLVLAGGSCEGDCDSRAGRIGLLGSSAFGCASAVYPAILDEQCGDRRPFGRLRAGYRLSARAKLDSLVAPHPAARVSAAAASAVVCLSLSPAPDMFSAIRNSSATTSLPP